MVATSISSMITHTTSSNMSPSTTTCAQVPSSTLDSLKNSYLSRLRV